MAQFIEKVYRSRQTVLDILRERGYDTVGPEKFGPEEIREALALGGVGGGKALEFTVTAKEDAPNAATPTVRVYVFMTRLKNKLPGFIQSLEIPIGAVDPSARQPDKLGSPVDPEQTSIICLINDPVVSVFNQASVSAWNLRKLRLTFFNIDSFQMNPLRHYLVPKHEVVPPETHAALMKDRYITSKAQFPLIRYHEDPITRVIGCIPGDIIKITRPSPSAGEYIIYRAVVA